MIDGLAQAVAQNRTALLALTTLKNYDNDPFTHMVNVSILTMGQARGLGIDGFAFMKSTQSGWAMYLKDPYTTIPETDDRMCATSMVATWTWSGKPVSYPGANKTILDTLLEVFSNTYSYSVQDSLYRMGEAALAAVPEISEISMACPNMHFILMNLSAFGLDNKNDVFLPTDEPHGQIECTVGRG